MQWRKVFNEVLQFCIQYQKQKQKPHIQTDIGFATDDVTLAGLALNPQKVTRHFFGKDASIKWQNTHLIVDTMYAYGVRDIRQAAYILATVWHETNATMQPVKEAYWLSEAWRQQNLSYYPWYGRGYVQLTWQANYEKADRILKLNGVLVVNPDHAMQADISAKILVYGCMQGWFTGKKLSDYIGAERCDYRQARCVVNGVDQADKIRQYALLWQDCFE